MIVFVFLLMIWLHILDDFHLQGILANMKQKSWWLNHPEYEPMYQNDYKICLIIHAFSWSFLVHLPGLLIVNIQDPKYCFIGISVIIHCIIHAIVDDCKANKRIINLVTDQAVHFVQIVVIFLTYIIL